MTGVVQFSRNQPRSSATRAPDRRAERRLRVDPYKRIVPRNDGFSPYESRGTTREDRHVRGASSEARERRQESLVPSEEGAREASAAVAAIRWKPCDEGGHEVREEEVGSRLDEVEPAADRLDVCVEGEGTFVGVVALRRKPAAGRVRGANRPGRSLKEGGSSGLEGAAPLPQRLG